MKQLRMLGAGEYSIDEAVKHLQKTDCYSGWEEELRYFLFRYEEYLAGVANQAFDNEQWIHKIRCREDPGGVHLGVVAAKRRHTSTVWVTLFCFPQV
jgi:hypothetical protein